MLGILFALGATLFGGLSETLAKKAMSHGTRYKAIVYNYLAIVALLIAGALILGVPFVFPPELLPAFIIQSVIGAAAIAALFKALDSGKASIIAPLSVTYILIVLLIGVLAFGEAFGPVQLGGAALMVVSAAVLALEDIRGFRFEKGMLYLVAAVLGWGYYYSFIKLFIPAMGPYMATVMLESGVAFFVIAYYLARNKDLSPPPRAQAGIIAIRSVLMFLGTVLYTYAVADIGVVLTSVIAAGGPLVSVPTSYLLLGEKLSIHKYAAVALIVLGFLLVLS